MDGVLVNSEPIHEKAQKIVCEQFGLDVPESISSTFKGWTEDRVYKYIAKHFGTGSTTVKNLINAKHSAFASLAHEVELMPGALDLVQYSHSMGIPLGLVTSATKADQERAFQNHNLSSYFSSIVTVEDVLCPKPDPEPFIQGSKNLGIPPSECLVIEDSKYGIQSGLDAGCHVFGLASTFTHQILEETGAQKVFDSIPEIKSYLKSLPVHK